MAKDDKLPKVGGDNDQLVQEITKTADKLNKLQDEKKEELRKEGFLKMLYEHPPQGMIQARQSYLYTPISYVESTLDRLFLGLWQIDNFQWTTHSNEMVGSIDLSVFHPVAKQWIKRTGAAAIAVRQLKDSKVEEFMTTKIKNALEQDFPHLKADCIKNAANSFGVVFGRDLNRTHIDKYNPILTSLEDKLETTLSGLLEAAKLDGLDVDALVKKAQKK